MPTVLPTKYLNVINDIFVLQWLRRWRSRPGRAEGLLAWCHLFLSRLKHPWARHQNPYFSPSAGWDLAWHHWVSVWMWGIYILCVLGAQLIIRKHFISAVHWPITCNHKIQAVKTVTFGLLKHSLNSEQPAHHWHTHWHLHTSSEYC